MKSTDPKPSPGPPASIPPRGDGVDDTLILWMLSLSPRERLEVLQQSINGLGKLQRGKNIP